MMLAIIAPMFENPIDSRAPLARGGVLDLSDYPETGRPIQAQGQWRLSWLGPDPPAQAETSLINVPGQWTGHRLADGAALPMNGRARYELTLRGLKPGPYLMHIQVLWSGNRITLDGKPVGGLGRIGDGPGDTRYHLRSQQFPFVATGRDMVLGIEMASFLHRENAMEEPPTFGSPAAMDRWLALKWSREHLYNISLLLIAALGIAVFLFRPQDRASLYFGLSCLTFLPTAAILGFDNIFMLMFPHTSYPTMLAIQYLSGIVAVTFFFLNAHELFPRESSKWMARAILTGFALAFAVHSALLLAGDTLRSSLFQQKVFMMLALFTLAYMIAILIRAAWNRRDGAFLYLLGFSLFISTFFLNTTVMSGWVSRDQVVGYEFVTLGIVMLLYTHVVLMAERWSLSVGKAEQINEDLRQLLEVNTAITSDLQLGSLLEKIVAVTSKIIHADRSSLFLKDRDGSALTSAVAQGVDGEPLRFDAGRGLAGYVFATGETVNVPDAYADERFNRSIDDATGYRTRSVLTVPVTARDGRRIGVMQALNRRDGAEFSSDDAARAVAFGAQAAVAIENARLFGEALAARSFDESILRSMSGGVIALDRDWKITKLNAAAAEILGASVTLLAGLDARALLSANNTWLIEELGAVAEGGEPKLLLDVALVTARDKPSSVNLSITPLEGEEGRVGVLLVIEDISEEKRLQGAMRRFMTQEVVDQVMSRDDESLFGTACTASVLFADIRGFTSLAEELSARETVETLNELFTELYEAVSGHGGVLDKYIGDAVMAVYGAPIASGRDPQNALDSGLAMLRMLDEVNARRAGRGAAALRIGIGIATGEVVAGTIGSPKRMDYTVIGDSVNLAARLQDLTKTYGVEMLIDETTARSIEGLQPLREIDLIAVRGRKRPETVFEVLARAPSDPARGETALAAYAQGRAALAERRWDDARAAFARAAELDPADRPAQLMVARTRLLSGAPPGDEWDGVWRDSPAAAMA
ncbi:MAG: GAF domain-containing protein [Novosphingobium sp.]|nr:GAF domain-containing protein [Novosphingobium sp.]